MYLKKCKFPPSKEGYPYSIDVLNDKTIIFNEPITIFVGSNGSGKTTILESIASSINSINISNQSIMDDDLFSEIRIYAKDLKLSYSTMTKRGFFFRASDFITYRHGIRLMKKQLQREIERVKFEYKDKSIFARNQALTPFTRSLNELENQGRELTKLSHGESFLEFFSSRFNVPGIYILDEPETPLSFENQYAFMVMINEMVKKGAQFIISTHSPVIAAIDNAEIIDLDKNMAVVDYDSLNSVSFIKDFVNNKDRYIHYLNKED